MKAILLAAGLGTRLAPLTEVLPKCLMPVHGRPLLEYWILALARAGVTEALVNLHHRADLVAAYLAASRFPIPVRAVHEPELLGTAGTLAKNAAFCGDAPCLLVHADNLCLADFPGFLAAHAARPAGTVLSMMLFRTPTPRSCGVVGLDAAGRVVTFHEKVADPPGNLANGAVYVVEPEIVRFVTADPGRTDFSLDVIPHFLGRMLGWENTGYHRDIGTLDSFLAAQTETEPLSPPSAEADGWRALATADGGRLAEAFRAALARGLAASGRDPDTPAFRPVLAGPRRHRPDRPELVFCATA